MGRNIGPQVGAAVEADTVAARRTVGRDAARVRPEALRRVFGRDPALERGPGHDNVRLRDAKVGQGGAGGDLQLGLDEVNGRHFFGDRVLDLDPGVHLYEHVAARPVHQELDGAGVEVADSPGKGHGVGPEPGPSPAGRLGAGAISTTFWWRRWTEQSRS